MNPDPKKLTIIAFSDKKLESPTGMFFVAPINPDSYEQSFQVVYDDQPALGGQGAEGRFKFSAPEELSLEFVLDATGTVYGYHAASAKLSVLQQIKEFKATVYNIQGEIHQPHFLKLVWSHFTFDAVLRDLKISFVLFDNDGIPLRARLSCTFLNYRETERRVREEGKSSPDLTHVIVVQDNDRLPDLTHRIYGSPKHYLEVARANDLTSIRNVRSKKELTFFPLEKVES